MYLSSRRKEIIVLCKIPRENLMGDKKKTKQKTFIDTKLEQNSRSHILRTRKSFFGEEGVEGDAVGVTIAFPLLEAS